MNDLTKQLDELFDAFESTPDPRISAIDSIAFCKHIQTVEIELKKAYDAVDNIRIKSIKGIMSEDLILR